MKTFKNYLILGLLAALSAFAQQNTIVATTLSAAVASGANSITVASATGINAPSGSTPASALYVVDEGQQVGDRLTVVSISSTTIRVSGLTRPHASGAMVLVATSPDWFQTVDPRGSCVRASTFVTPWVNISNGRQWYCSTETLTWIPHWGNQVTTKQIVSSSATASVAGATAIAGPYLKISGTEAITSFTMGVGWNGDDFCVYPTGAFTVTATNNIAKAATAVADRTLCFKWDTDGGKFAPSY